MLVTKLKFSDLMVLEKMLFKDCFIYIFLCQNSTLKNWTWNMVLEKKQMNMWKVYDDDDDATAKDRKQTKVFDM